MAQYIFCALTLHTRVNEPKWKGSRLNGGIRLDGILLELSCKTNWDNMVDDHCAYAGRLDHGVMKVTGGGYTYLHDAFLPFVQSSGSEHFSLQL